MISVVLNMIVVTANIVRIIIISIAYINARRIGMRQN